ncbi:MAG: hypothetical protein AAGA22_01160 [Pseudomonadota bacterium]
MPADTTTTFVTLRKYITWALGEGCRITTGYASGQKGVIYYTVVNAPEPSRRYAVIEDIEMDEALPSHDWKHYDRRLGLTSPFGQKKH